ncbi:MAG TPA: YqiA/YcfP family alpha/beta fold hydrolase [Thermoanaerobaculia bacterium]
MRSVLYLHGFASSPASAKITALRPLLEPQDIELNAPDLNVPSFERLDFDVVVAHALAAARETPPHAIAGSSLGALVALAVAKQIARPLVLIAPALGVARRWQEKLPAGDPVIVYNFARNADVPIHRAFFEQMAALHIDDEPPPSRVTAIMGRNDETVPFAMVREAWERWEASGRLAAGSRFLEIDEGDHGLVSYADAIAEAIAEAVS